MNLNPQAMTTAESVGQRVSREWPMIEADDITQHVLMKACTRVDEYNALDPAALYDAMRREATAWCAKERASYVTMSARYLYTPAEVRELLELWADGGESTWALPPTKDGYLAAPDAGNIVVNVWDLKTAIGKLPDTWRGIIIRRITGDSLTPSEYRTWCRAIERLTLTLNRVVNAAPLDHEGPGARKAIPNARAYAMTSSDREG